jgi:hypothetical protein
MSNLVFTRLFSGQLLSMLDKMGGIPSKFFGLAAVQSGII